MLYCNSMCTYCYLNSISFSKKNFIKSADDILFDIKKNNLLITKDTIITFGCFSECFDDCVKLETIKLVKFFLKNGNQVQISSKKKLFSEDFFEISKYISYYGQLVFFISCACITDNQKIEVNTSNIEDRFQNFLILKKFNICSCLYIKPVLKNITFNDTDLFLKYISKYDIKNVVVGSIFSSFKNEGDEVSFINQKKFYYYESSDEKIIFEKLSTKCNVFTRSLQVLEKYKKNFKI